MLLAGVSQPLIALAGFMHAQFIVRAVLGGFNAACLVVFGAAVREAFGKGAARWWVLFSVTQFHVVFYLSRTLPNMFAFGLSELLPFSVSLTFFFSSCSALYSILDFYLSLTLHFSVLNCA